MSSTPDEPSPRIEDARVIALRPPSARPDGARAAGAFVEDERSRAGVCEPVATVILVGRECPFRCTMCDLWKGTTLEPLEPGAVPAQLEAALAPLPPAKHLKLYNSGSFFDPLAIRREDRAPIAARAAGFDTLIVESHPLFIGAAALAFRDRLAPALEIAIGLETAHPRALALLNKRMDVDDYRRATAFLRAEGVFVRTFVLLDPPHVPRREQVAWAVRSLETAFAAGSDTVVLIPSRPGNGAMEAVAADGEWEPGSLDALVDAAERGLALGGGRVFADLWDLERFATATSGYAALRARLEAINRTQE